MTKRHAKHAPAPINLDAVEPHVRAAAARIRAARVDGALSPVEAAKARIDEANAAYAEAVAGEFPEFAKGESLTEERSAELRAFRTGSEHGLSVDAAHAEFVAVADGLTTDEVHEAARVADLDDAPGAA